jgi:3-dehydroquinate synthase
MLNNARRVIIICDKNIPRGISEVVEKSLVLNGFQIETILLQVSETTKSLYTITKLYHQFLKMRLDRICPVFTVGGGVIGDVTGFASATYMRGLPLFQIPTTFLAQVDSSIGGKVGINLSQGKNLVGTFYQPKATFIDPSLLLTLPESEIKCGLILNKDIFIFVSNNIEKIKTRNVAALEEIVKKMVYLKSRIVQKDEKDEKGFRVYLNYGHTIGHAIESAYQYKGISHGEAVSIGISMEARLAEKLGLVSCNLIKKQDRLLLDFGLPIRIEKPISAKKLINFMEFDKKTRDGRLCFVLPTNIGKGKFPVFVSRQLVQKILKEIIYE